MCASQFILCLYNKDISVRLLLLSVCLGRYISDAWEYTKQFLTDYAMGKQMKKFGFSRKNVQGKNQIINTRKEIV